VIAGFYKDSSDVYHGFVRSAAGSITEFNAAGAGTGSTEGTQPLSINTDGVITGAYVDSNGVDHGFIRAADGAITEFDDPDAAPWGQATIQS
jgi:hypothetical protein